MLNINTLMTFPNVNKIWIMMKKSMPREPRKKLFFEYECAHDRRRCQLNINHEKMQQSYQPGITTTYTKWKI